MGASRMQRLLERLRGSSIIRDLGDYERRLEAVDALQPRIDALSDADLTARSRQLRRRARGDAGQAHDDLLPEAFALTRAAARRALGLDPFPVQLIGAIGLHEGKIVEMRTGEGKTLTAVFPAALNALAGRGVHVLTFNDYLARRDAEWMGPVYRLLGLGVGCVQEGMDPSQRRAAYARDITYLTAKEAGFDYLRDGLVADPADAVHRPFHYALVDEADSILIDEARVPLVLAGAVAAQQTDPERLAAVVARLAPGVDYATDLYARNAFLTEAGIDRAEALLACPNLHAPEHLDLLTQLNQALHARALFRRDVDYIVRHGRVELVDELTGRTVEDRHWPDGLQAAVEAKEGIAHRDDGLILGSIALQHFLALYPRLCGMTATAEPSAEEFQATYGLEVLVVPPNRPDRRRDHPDQVYTHKEAKERALVADIRAAHATGRPVLVGTASVAESEALAAALAGAGVACRVLNAKRDESEAGIVAAAGAPGAVTISTNMAGRGTDILLGGRDGADRDRVVDLGGLYVIGTNRHESRRIDRQLRGRAGRQGDPGASRFFTSLEDDLFRRYDIAGLIPADLMALRRDGPLDHPVVRREIDRLQRIVEGQAFAIRRGLRDFSFFVEQQRRIVRQRRDETLMGRAPQTLLRRRAPRRYEKLLASCGEAALQEAERRLALFHIDRCWAEHLAAVAEIRDGIHLVGIAGLSPLEEFQRQAGASFEAMLQGIDDRIAASFAAATITAAGIDLAAEGLKGPSSTWTYIVDDDAVNHGLAGMLAGDRNIGMATGGSLILGPILFLWTLLRWFRRG